LFILVYTSR